MSIHRIPALTATQAASLLDLPDAVVVLNLTTGRTRLHTRPAADVWDAPDRLVLATHDDAVAAAATAGKHDLAATVAATLNTQLADLAAAGEIPTLEELEAVLAELDHFQAEVIDLAARRGGAA